MSKGNVEYLREYNMITGGESTTERCVAGMIQNDYIYRKMMCVCIELRLAQDVKLYLIYRISKNAMNAMYDGRKEYFPEYNMIWNLTIRLRKICRSNKSKTFP